MNIVDRIISPNLWDEEWNYISGEIRGKNLIAVIPTTTYYFKAPNNNVKATMYWHNNGDYTGTSSVVYGNKAFTCPVNVNGISLTINATSYGSTTYNHNICINESNPSINGKYFPYVMYKRYDIVDKPIYELPEGYIPTDIEVGGSYGVVDLGTLNWYLSNGVFVTNEMPVATYKSSINTLPKILNTKYTVVNTQYFGDFLDNAPNNSITVAPNQKQLFVKDSSYTDATTFKSSLSGNYLIYERSNPSSPTLVRGNNLNKFCIYNGQIGVYGDTFKYNSNIPLKQWLRRLKIGG